MSFLNEAFLLPGNNPGEFENSISTTPFKLFPAAENIGATTIGSGSCGYSGAPSDELLAEFRASRILEPAPMDEEEMEEKEMEEMEEKEMEQEEARQLELERFQRLRYGQFQRERFQSQSEQEFSQFLSLVATGVFLMIAIDFIKVK